MKSTKSVLFSGALFLIVCGCAHVGTQQRGIASPADGPKREASPKLFMNAAPVFDSDCQQRTGFVVDPSWYMELSQTLPEFQKKWDARAHNLITTSEKLSGHRFARKEYSVALTLCKWTPMGIPFIVSARVFLNGSAVADPIVGKALSQDAFVTITHHELLHSLLDFVSAKEFFNYSRLIAKHHTESTNVIVHLHLIALQIQTYKELGETDLLASAKSFYDLALKQGSKDYNRAWEIVNQEGPAAFISELQGYQLKQ